MKRIVIAALAALPGAALAQQPGEVALQVSAVGSVQRPADEVVETVLLSVPGDTREAARTALDAKVAAVKKALTGAGVAADAIKVVIDGGTVPLVAPPPPPPPVVVPGQSPAIASAIAAAQAHRTTRASATFTVTFGNPALVSRIDEAVVAQGASVSGRPRYTLKDDKTARVAAAAEALATARANADRYAAALKMRIVRMTRVADYGQSLDLTQIGDLASSFDPTQRGNAEVTVHARVWIDFVMAPL